MSILKDVYMVLTFNTGSDYSMFKARIHNSPAVENRVLNVSSRRKRLTNINERYCETMKELLEKRRITKRDNTRNIK